MLDIQSQSLIRLGKDSNTPDFADLEPTQCRAFLSKFLETTAPRSAEVDVSNRMIPGPAGEMVIRSYRPRNASEKLPVLVYMHGGGFVIGNLDDYDGLCSSLAERSNCCVVSVDYRLAPEHRFPAAVEDCYAALRWVGEHGEEIDVDTSRIAVGGDSAGGNLAAVSVLIARDNGNPKIRFQFLLYPVLSGLTDGTQSWQANGEGYILTRRAMRYFYDHYTGGRIDESDFRFSPLRARDLANLPSTLMIVAGFDPLRDEGVAYAQRMLKDGSDVVLTEYAGTVHGFIASWGGVLEAGQQGLDQVAGALRRALKSQD